MVDSDAEAEEPPSREEIVARHEPIHTRHRSGRKQARGMRGVILMAWGLACGVWVGMLGSFLWVRTSLAFFEWLPLNWITLYVVWLIPPAVGLAWVTLRAPEQDLSRATKVFLVAMLVSWLSVLYWGPMLLRV